MSRHRSFFSIAVILGVRFSEADIEPRARRPKLSVSTDPRNPRYSRRRASP
jgi:hypothetical protein